MSRKHILLTLLVILLLNLPTMPAFAGGWAVATLDAWPDAVVAGEPVEIGFTVRQHGVTTLEALAPVITAMHRESEASFKVGAIEDAPGHYSATLTFPEAGEWDWMLTAFGPDQPLPTLTVLPEDTDPEATPEAPDDPDAALAELGATLFVAKGCAVCHEHSGVEFGVFASNNLGPELSDYSSAPDFLAQWLADPASVDPNTVMPDLDLDEAEIEALIAFLNADAETAE